jgi:eukaryotic-like serine/threonine-protein kinase
MLEMTRHSGAMQLGRKGVSECEEKSALLGGLRCNLSLCSLTYSRLAIGAEPVVPVPRTPATTMDEASNAGAIADLCVRIGLIDDHTSREMLMELGDKQAPASDMIQLLQRRSLITPWQGSKLIKGDRDGYFLGGYRLLYKISSGTFGRVYRGDDPGTGQVVAVKVLRHKWTDNKQKVELFMREGRVGLSMQHNNIVQILAVSQDNKTGQYYIVMEFVEGGNLRDIMSIRKKLNSDEALGMMEECVSALAYAWSKGLTHRDIKPTNILVSADKTMKLVDFGLAEMTMQVQNSGSVEMGRMSDKDDDVAVDRTLDYAGLEKATGVTKGDIRSDIYFLGHVLFEMITGEPLMAVTRDKNVKMGRRRYEEVETLLSDKGPKLELPPACQRLIGKAVAFEPSMRFQTPAAFLEAIKATRAELAGTLDTASSHRAPGPLTIYVVEGNLKLQDIFRDKFKKMGFRVLISADATQAHKRYLQAPYHALLIDGRLAGREGLDCCRKVAKEAHSMRLDLTSLFVLGADQGRWVDEIKVLPGNSYALPEPLGMKQVASILRDHLPELNSAAEEAE